MQQSNILHTNVLLQVKIRKERLDISPDIKVWNAVLTIYMHVLL